MDSSDMTMYYAIGGGAFVSVMMVICLCCCCKADTKEKTTGNLEMASSPQYVPAPDRPSEPWEDPEVKKKRLQLRSVIQYSLLHEGSFTQVYKGTYENQSVAIKKLLPHAQGDISQKRALFAEVKVMARISHPRIVRFVGVAWEDLGRACVLTEYMAGRDLRSMLNLFHARRYERGMTRQKLAIAMHITEAVAFLHSRQPSVLHRGLTSRSILLDERHQNAKISDFGISRTRSDDLMTGRVGLVLWMAPEVMKSSAYDEKADIFSLGVILSELDTHEEPYETAKMRKQERTGRNVTDMALMMDIQSGDAQVAFSTRSPLDFLSAALACVDMEPFKRPSAAQLLAELRHVAENPMLRMQ